MRIQEDLIGAERERRGDEKRRAALHAEWAAGRDEDEIKELMEGVKGGFRKRRRAGALDDAVRHPNPETLEWTWSWHFAVPESFGGGAPLADHGFPSHKHGCRGARVLEE